MISRKYTIKCLFPSSLLVRICQTRLRALSCLTASFFVFYTNKQRTRWKNSRKKLPASKTTFSKFCKSKDLRFLYWRYKYSSSHCKFWFQTSQIRALRAGSFQPKKAGSTPSPQRHRRRTSVNSKKTEGWDWATKPKHGESSSYIGCAKATKPSQSTVM